MPDLPYQVDLTASARKELRALPKEVLGRLFQVLKDLSTTPRPAGSKKLTNSLSAWRVRVGDYRIVYAIDDKERIVEVIRIAHRGEVYRNHWLAGESSAQCVGRGFSAGLGIWFTDVGFRLE